MEVTETKTVEITLEERSAEVIRIGRNYLVSADGGIHSHLVYKGAKAIECTCQKNSNEDWVECMHIRQLRRAHQQGQIRRLEGRSPLEAIFDRAFEDSSEIEMGGGGTPIIPWPVVVERLSNLLNYSGWGFELPAAEVYSDPWMAGLIDEKDVEDMAKSDTITVNGPNRIVVTDTYGFKTRDAKEHMEETQNRRRAFVEQAEARQSKDGASSLGIGIELFGGGAGQRPRPSDKTDYRRLAHLDVSLLLSLIAVLQWSRVAGESPPSLEAFFTPLVSPKPARNGAGQGGRLSPIYL